MACGRSAAAVGTLEPRVFKVTEGKGGRRFRVERMISEHYEECVDMVTDAFLNRNPIFQAAGVTEQALRTIGHTHLRQCFNSGLSLVAVDDASGSLAAFLFIEQMNVFNDHIPKDPEMRSLFTIGE